MDFKLDHSFSELKEGHTYIMTIQDSNVLDDGDDDGVLLEDQNLQSVFRQKIKQKQKLALANLNSRKLLQNDEEDEWGEEGILSKYDDIA